MSSNVDKLANEFPLVHKWCNKYIDTFNKIPNEKQLRTWANKQGAGLKYSPTNKYIAKLYVIYQCFDQSIVCYKRILMRIK